MHNVANHMEDRKGCCIQVTKRISEKVCTPSHRVFAEEMVKIRLRIEKWLIICLRVAHSCELSHGLEKCYDKL